MPARTLRQKYYCIVFTELKTNEMNIYTVCNMYKSEPRFCGLMSTRRPRHSVLRW